MKGFFGTCVAGLGYGVLGMGKINRLFDGAADYQGPEFADHLLENMEITFDFPQEQLENIPKEGPFVVVSNHPFGGIEGVMMLSLITKVRPDFKIMANFILSHIPNLKDCFLSVNPFTDNPEWKSSVGGIKGALKQLSDGHGLGVFPAGEVSRYHGHDYPEDLPWSKSIARIIKKMGAPVVPLYWEGRNSRLFYAVDRIHTMLGTSRLMRELANKKGRSVQIQIGKPILPDEFADYEQPEDWAAYLRARTYALEANLEKCKPQLKSVAQQPLGEAMDSALLVKELESIRKEAYLFSSANYECYLTDYDKIPNIMKEVARLRVLPRRVLESAGIACNKGSRNVDRFQQGAAGKRTVSDFPNGVGQDDLGHIQAFKKIIAESRNGDFILVVVILVFSRLVIPTPLRQGCRNSRRNRYYTWHIIRIRIEACLV